MTKIAVLLFMCVGFSLHSFAQDAKELALKKDSISIPKQVAAYATDKFAIIRPLNVEFSNASPYNFSPKGNHAFNKGGRVEDFKQIKVSMTSNFIKRKTWFVGVTFGYKYTSIDSNLFEGITQKKQTLKQDFHHHFTSLNFVYFSSLFGKRTIYTSSLIVDGSEQHFERVKGLVSGIVILRSDAKVKMTAGIVGNIDPTSKIPVLPLFTYEYQMDNGFIFDVTLPKSVYLRKFIFTTSRLSLGSEMEQTSFYVYEVEGTKQRYEYRQLDVNAGLIYEHAIGDFIVTAKTGIKLTPSARMFEKEKKFDDAVLEIKPDPTFYFNLGVSFNPFTLLKKKP
ncbi:DUF6268 family outer membrane beta-barrel protein [Myroides odoratus]|uniref:DUF6268 family outer membrane beta-barrel protein n=1 Tax=Myroides odoratus TaxID=256 RepID=UPI0039B02BA6